MTVMAAEAGAAAFEGEAAAATSAGAAEAGAGQASTTGRAARASRAAPAARPQTTSRGGRGQRRSGGRDQAAQIAQTGPGTRGFGLEGAWPSSNYQGVILGEFVLAVLLVAATPFAKKNQTGVSPYAGKDMIQLLALTMVYFLLAVLAGTSHGSARFAAWFGGLILLAVGLTEAANIASAVSKFLSPGTPAPAAPAGNPSTVNPGSTQPPTGIARASAQNPGTGLA